MGEVMKEEKETEQSSWSISKLDILGLWGYRNFYIPLNPDVNILIGPNGSGKTSIISMLASTLQLDFESLFEFDFEDLTITFRSESGDENELFLEKRRPGFRLSWHGNSFSDPKVVPIVRRRRFLRRGLSPTLPPIEESKFDTTPEGREGFEEIKDWLSKSFGISWFSVNRLNLHDEDEEKKERTLTSVKGELSKYLARRGAEEREEYEKFQKQVFNFQQTTLDNIDRYLERLDENKKRFNEILGFLDISSEKGGVDFDAAEDILRKWKKNEPVEVKDVPKIANYFRVDGLSRNWLTANNEIKVIYERWNKLKSSLEKMLLEKEVEYNENNIPVFRTSLEEAPDNQIGIEKLSSGERHLFVFPAEALLSSEGEGHTIIISDEPELSLHVEWQQEIIENIMELNNNCQIIVATHSPEISGGFPENIIDVADCG
jgi:predicted ATPase